MDDLIFDTTFLIDLQREAGKGHGPAQAFLEANRQARIALPVVALGEFAEGFAVADDPALKRLARLFTLLPVTAAVAVHYGRITRGLRRAGRLIGANDLWIAATALDCGHPLVTRNVEHFARVPGVRVCGY